MRGLHAVKRWTAVLAAASVCAIVGAGAGPATAASPVAKAEAQAINGEGAIVGLLDTGDCKTAVPVADPGTGPDLCGDGLNTAAVKAFRQRVSGTAAGTSSGSAGAAPLNLADLAQIQTTDLVNGLQNLNTGTILDPLIAQNPLLAVALQTLQTTLTPQLDAVLNTITSAIGDTITVALEVGAVTSQAQASAKPKSATGSSGITAPGLRLRITLAGQNIIVPITLGTAPNTPVLLSVDDIVAGITQGLQDTLTDSLAGALAPLAQIIATGDDLVISQIMAALQDPLAAIGEAIAPLVQGTVNKQTNAAGQSPEGQTPPDDGYIEVIALELILLDGVGDPGRQTLQLARAAAGPNSPAAVVTPPDSDSDCTSDCDSDSDSDSDEPKAVASGVDQGGNLAPLGVVGFLAGAALVGAAVRQRFILNR